MKRRFRDELSPFELARLHEAVERHLTLAQLVKMAWRSPRLIAEVFSAAASATLDGLAANSTLVWLLDSERARLAVPDAAAGVGWLTEEMFVPTALRFATETGRALEIGCGGGRITRLVAPRVGELVATDTSPTMLAEARLTLVEFPNVKLVRARSFLLDEFPSESFNLVFSQGLTPYLDPLQVLAMLAESRRVLRSGGACILNFDTVDSNGARERAVSTAREAARNRRFRSTAPRPYTSEGITTLYHAAGFLDVELVWPDPQSTLVVTVGTT
jgi:SAM-dependent methyltransferase